MIMMTTTTCNSLDKILRNYRKCLSFPSCECTSHCYLLSDLETSDEVAKFTCYILHTYCKMCTAHGEEIK
jgi:hypothetical protein